MMSSHVLFSFSTTREGPSVSKHFHPLRRKEVFPLNVRKLSLEERLDRLSSSCAAHPEFYPSVLRSVAGLELPAYMAGFDRELEELLRVLRLSPEEGERTTVRQAAVRIAGWYTAPTFTSAASDDLMDAVEGMRLLALPMGKIYQEHFRREDET